MTANTFTNPAPSLAGTPAGGLSSSRSPVGTCHHCGGYGFIHAPDAARISPCRDCRPDLLEPRNHADEIAILMECRK